MADNEHFSALLDLVADEMMRRIAGHSEIEHAAETVAIALTSRCFDRMANVEFNPREALTQ